MRRSRRNWSKEKGKTGRRGMCWNIGKEKWGGMERVGIEIRRKCGGMGCVGEKESENGKKCGYWS